MKTTYMLTIVYEETERHVFYDQYGEAMEQFRDIQEAMPSDVKAVYIAFLMHKALC